MECVVGGTYLRYILHSPNVFKLRLNITLFYFLVTPQLQSDGTQTLTHVGRSTDVNQETKAAYYRRQIQVACLAHATGIDPIYLLSTKFHLRAQLIGQLDIFKWGYIALVSKNV